MWQSISNEPGIRRQWEKHQCSDKPSPRGSPLAGRVTLGCGLFRVALGNHCSLLANKRCSLRPGAISTLLDTFAIVAFHRRWRCVRSSGKAPAPQPASLSRQRFLQRIDALLIRPNAREYYVRWAESWIKARAHRSPDTTTHSSTPSAAPRICRTDTSANGFFPKGKKKKGISNSQHSMSNEEIERISPPTLEIGH